MLRFAPACSRHGAAPAVVFLACSITFLLDGRSSLQATGIVFAALGLSFAPGWRGHDGGGR